ncbi:clathrin adaptor, mu subunit [Ascodesmis nigricans]|uniref:Clathrin adaptor, mu subunit n=1 Tax=Ascodesmis nigricans TaxID=341454 RepID=A0A4S2N1C4_9PEZI|nr:clathrin adaptor, mu subunit [Ascodesmis nigricans]
MSAIEALYIYDTYTPTPTLLLSHTFRTHASTSSSTLLQSYLAYPTQPPPSLIYLPTTAPPTLLFSITHQNLLLLSPSTSEIEPLLVLTFLHRVLDVLEDYLGSPLLPSKLEGNYDIVLQLLTEMADDGIPFTTEPNALRDVVLPPSTLGKIFGSVTGLPSNSLPPALAPGSQPPAQLSTIPWRRANVKHTANELYVDVIELLTCTIAPSGRPLSARVAGTIAFTAKISGVPDLLLNLTSPAMKQTRLGLPPTEVVKNPSFHPCVRLNRWKERPGELSFVPPDGKFVLASYEMDLLDSSTSSTSSLPPLNLPVSIDLTPSLGPAADEFELRVFMSTSSLPLPSSSSATSSSHRPSTASSSSSSTPSGTTGAPTIEDVVVTIPLPPRVKSLTSTRCSRGEFSFEAGEIIWRIPSTGSSGVSGTATFRTGVVVREDDDEDSDGNEEEEAEGQYSKEYDEYDEKARDEYGEQRAEKKRLQQTEKKEKEKEAKRKNAKIMPRCVVLGFAVKGWLASGVKVESLRIVGGKGLGEGVKPYKGVKYVTKSSGVEVRC